eukprot:Skav228205  [mRNA]  locus=scaffold704:705577:707031:+ [translate_table: standard]
MVQAHGPQRPWPWQRALTQWRADQRQTPETDDEALLLWKLRVLECVSTLHIENTVGALEMFPYHGQLAIAIFDALQEDWHSPWTTNQVEQSLVLQEAIEFWSHNALVPTVRGAGVPFELAQLTLASIRVPAVATHTHVLPHIERRRDIIAKLWTDDDVVVQLQRQVHREHQYIYVLPTPVVLRMCSSPVFLYVFSGRRRPGDVQVHLEHYLATLQIQAHILLIDLALSDRHDVTNPTLISKLIHWVRSGHVAGLITAPPCETWSQARSQLTLSSSDPRPLRSADQPLCISGLTTAELQQLLVSNVLLYTSLRLLFHAAVCGVPGIMEHPVEPHDRSRPSIWKLPWTRMMRETGLIILHDIQQARFGATAVKPTTFAVCHLPKFRASLGKFAQTVHWDQLETLTGRRDDGSWRTAIAKEYPDKLNEGLAYSLAFAYHSRRSTCTDFEAATDFVADVQYYYAGNVDFSKQTMRPDYAGPTEWDQLD